MSGRPDGAQELARRGVVRAPDLVAMGVQPPVAPLAGDWLVAPDLADALVRRLREAVDDHVRKHPMEAGLPLETARRMLDLPDLALVSALADRAGEGVLLREGRLTSRTSVPPEVSRAVGPLLAELEAEPFAAPDADALARLGLGPRELAAAVRAGLLVRLADRVVVAPDAPERAVAQLGELPQPFTLSEARQALGTTRRVAVPLLEWLQKQGRTRRVGDRHQVVG